MKPRSGPEFHSENRFSQPVSTADQVIEPIGQFYGGCFKCAAEMNAEAASFVQHRIEEDLQLTQRLAQCRNPVDIYNTQVGFCVHMMEDYVLEGQKMLGMASAITTNSDMTNGTSGSSSKKTNNVE